MVAGKHTQREDRAGCEEETDTERAGHKQNDRYQAIHFAHVRFPSVESQLPDHLNTAHSLALVPKHPALPAFFVG